MKKVIFFVLATAFILFLPKDVFAQTSSARIYYDAQNVTRDVKLQDAHHYFADMGSGTLTTNVTLVFTDQITASGGGTIDVPLIRQAIASNGSVESVCDIGTAVSSLVAVNPSGGVAEDDYMLTVNYTLRCPMTMDAQGFTDLTLYFLPLSSQYPIDLISFGPVFTFTQNDNAAIVNSQNNTTNAVNDVNDSINNDSVPASSENSNTASSWASQSASDSVVSDMVLMPITLLNAFSSGFNGSCQAYNLGSLYGKNLTLPCINIANYLGSTLWGIIDVLMSGFLIYGIGKKFVRVFNDFTNLKDSQVDELYGGGNQ